MVWSLPLKDFSALQVVICRHVFVTTPVIDATDVLSLKYKQTGNHDATKHAK
jgi:hypothetical protein